MNKTILFFALLSYSVIVSQSFMYILSLKNVQLALGGESYVELRQLIDANMKSTFGYVTYAALLSGLLLLIVNVKAPGSLAFITAAIALVALITDILLMLKGSMPLNEVINSWSPNDYPAGWTSIRQQWFDVLSYRQIANITGFISLLTGAVFGGK